ncbi:MAG: histidine kinase [Propionibacteriaceae bacterium]|nr:histidine kinase [Propionibacteriaceae bacterium]
MFSFEPVGADRRPPWWRTALYVVLGGFGSLVSATISRPSWQLQHGDDVGLLLGTLGMLLAVTLPFALLWRHRHPFTLTVVAALLPLVVPIGNTLAFIMLATLIRRRRGPAVWWTAGLVAVTSTWVVVADALASPIGASVTKTAFAAERPITEDMVVSPGAIVILAVLGPVLAVGLGLLIRARGDAESAQVEVQAERAASERLGDEVARRAERERVAREVHDAMGHRLSLLNLHAGAMEANATDPRMAESAHLVRESATAAMDDLRSLLGVLRDPLGEEGPPVPLSRLTEVVAESAGAGQVVHSSIFISDPDAAHPTLTRGVYRIVQELLTNARKHAASEPLVLAVEGGPRRGIVIDARNRRAGSTAGAEAGRPAGASRGLVGMAERAALLGGTMRHGLEGDQFHVRIELPWRAA